MAVSSGSGRVSAMGSRVTVAVALPAGMVIVPDVAPKVPAPLSV